MIAAPPAAASPLAHLRQLLPWALIGFAAAPWVLSRLARWWWFADLATHFRFQCLLGTGVLGVGLLLARRWRPLAASGGLALLYGWPLIGSVYPFTYAQPPHGSLTVMTANVLVSNRDPGPLLAHVAAVDPDVLCLQEVDARWAADLTPLRARYPYRRVLPRPDPFGLAVFSRHPATFAVERAEDLPVIRAVVDVGEGGPLTVFNVHLATPVRRAWADRRNRAMRAIAGEAAAVGGPVLVVGDFNCTPWSPHFADLLAAGGLRDPRRGGRSPPSWRAANPLLALPIDHILPGGGGRAWGLRAGPDIGSDHRPLTARVLW